MPGSGDYNLNAHFGATDDISPALSQIIAGLQSAAAASAAFNSTVNQNASQTAAGFTAAGQAAQQMGQHGQAAGAAMGGAASGINQAGQAASGATVQIGSLNVTLTQSHQAAQQAQTMYLSLGAALSQLPGPLGNVAAGFGMLHGRISETQAGILAVTTTIGALSASLASGLGDMIGAGTQFQRTFAEVQVVMNATAEQMAALQKAAIDVGVTTQYNAQQAAKGLYELGSAGFTAAESIQALVPITTAAMLGNRNLGDTTKDVIAGIRQFGLTAADTTHVVDVMTLAVQGSVVHWNEIGGLFENLRGRMGQLRIPMEEVVAAEMLMTNSGLGASQAATAIGTAVDRLSKQTRETAQGLKELGLNVFDNEGKFVGLLNIYTQLEAKLPTMTVAQQAHAMAMLGGSKAAGAFLDILQQTQTVMVNGQETTLKGAELFEYWTKTLKDGGDAAAKAAKIIGETLDAELRKLGGTFGEASIRIGSQFLPALQAIVPQVMDAVNMFVQADPAIHAMAAAALAASVAFGTLTAAVGAWTAIQSTSFGPAIASATTFLIGLAPAMLGVVAAAAALGLAWETNFMGIRDHTKEAADSVGSSLRQITDDVSTAISYLQKIELPKLKVQIETGLGETGLGQLFADITDAKNMVAATEAGKLIGNALGLGIHAGIKTIPAIGPLIGLALDTGPAIEKAAADLHVQAAKWRAELDANLSPAEIAKKEAGELDAMAMGAVSKIKDGATLESAAMAALWDQVWAADKQGIDKTGISTQQNLDLVIARTKELMAKGGSDIGYALASSIAGSGNAVQDSINALMHDAGGDLTKALNAAIQQGNQIAATQIATTQAQHKVIQSAIAGSSAAYRVQIDIMEQAEGPIRALNQLYSDGHITSDQYNAAHVGIVKTTKDETAANSELEKSLKAVHAAMTPGQKIYEQQAQGVVSGISQGLSLDARARLADFQQGKTAQEQLKQMVEAAGTTGITLTDLYYGTPKQNEERVALLAAALQGGGIAKLAPAAKAAGQQYSSGVAEGIQTGQAAATKAAADSGTATAAALQNALKTGLTNSGAIGTQFAQDLADGMDFSAARDKAQNALALNPETYRAQGQAAGEAVPEGVAAGIAANTPAATNALQTFKVGLGLQAEGLLTPELAARMAGRFFEQLGGSLRDAANAGLPGLGDAFSTSLTNALLTGFNPGLLVGKLVSQIAASFAEGITTDQAIGASITGALNTVLDQIIVTLPGTLAGNIVRQITAGLGNLGEEIANHIKDGVDLAQTGAAIVTGITTSIEQTLGPEVSKAITLGLTGALNPGLLLTQFSATYLKIGTDIVGGIVEGIKQAIASGEAGGAVGGIVQQIKDKLGIKSPSTVAAEQIGRPLAQGIGVGFTEGIGEVQGLVQSGIQGLVAGMSTTMETGLGSMVSEITKKLNETVVESPVNLGERVGQANVSPGFSPITWDDVAKLMNFPELTSYDTSKSGTNIQNRGPGNNAKLKGWTIGPINFGDYQGEGDNGPETYNPYDQPPGLYPDDTTIARFSPGRRGMLGRGTGGVSLAQLLGGLGTGDQGTKEAATKIAEAIVAEIPAAVATAVRTERIGTAITGSVGNAGAAVGLPSTEQISQYIRDHPEAMPVYGPSPGDQARYERTRAIITGQATVTVGGRQVPGLSPYGNLSPAEQNYLLAGMAPMNNTVVGYRPLTTAEATQRLTPTMQYAPGPPGAPQASNWQFDTSTGRMVDASRLYGYFNQLAGAGTGGGVLSPPPGAIPYQGGAASGYEAPTPGTPTPDGRVWGYNGDRMTAQQWATLQAGRSPGMQVPGVPAGMSYAGAVAANPYNQVGPADAQAAEDFRRSLSGATAEAQQQERMQRLLSQADQGVIDHYVSQRDALREASAETRTQARAIRESSASATQAVQSLTEMANEIVPLNVGLSATVSGITAVRMSEEEWRSSLGGAVGETEGTFAHLNGVAQTTHQRLNDLGDIAQQNASSFSQIGDLSVGLASALDTTTAAASDFRSHAVLAADGLNTLNAGLSQAGATTFRWSSGAAAALGMNPALFGTLNVPQQFNDQIAQAMYQANLVQFGPQNAPSPLGYYQSRMTAFNAAHGVGATATNAPTLGTSGSGEAQVPIYASVAMGTIDPGNPTRDTNDAIARMNTEIQISQTHMQNLARNLANSVPLVMQSWSNIADYTKQADNSMAHVAGAFSAYAIDLNAKMVSSISGSWTMPTLGGPSGPMPVGGVGAGDNGNTAGGIAFSLTQAAGNAIVAANGGVVPQDFQQQLQKMLQGNKQYTDVVGQTTETTADLQQKQRELADRVFALQSEATSLGSAYAQGIGVMDQLNAAQAALTANAAVLAGSVGSGGGGAPPPIIQNPISPTLSTHPGDFGQVVIGGQNYPPGTTYNPLTGAITGPEGHWVGTQFVPYPTPTTGGIETNTITSPTTGTTTGPTTTTPAPITPPSPNAPVLVGHAGGQDIYRLSNGKIIRVTAGSTPSGVDSTLSGASADSFTRPVNTVVSSVAGVPIPNRAAVTIGDVHVTVNAAGGNVNDPIVIAKAGKALREELRRSGAFMARTRD